MKTLRILAFSSMVLLVTFSQSKAATDIYLLEGLPDLAGGFPGMDVTYNAGSSNFTASGYTFDYETSGGDVGVSVSDTYILSATINHSGVLTGGTLTINGAVGDDETSGELLAADLVTGAAGTAFGYGDNGNDQFQFLFKVSGGSLEGAFGGSGAAGGIILEANFNENNGDHPFTGSWASSFDNLDSAGDPGTGNGLINSFAPVPEPSSILLTLVGGVLCLAARRRLNVPRA